jgi:CDP-paratose 2-epimerase
VLDYARSFDIPTCVLRMSCIYGPRQMGTEDQGWVAHFLIRALEGKPISIYGDGCQVRDVLNVADAVEAYCAAWRRIEAVQGRAYNLGGGPVNAISLKQLILHIESLIGRPVETVYSDWRAGRPALLRVRHAACREGSRASHPDALAPGRGGARPLAPGGARPRPSPDRARTRGRGAVVTASVRPPVTVCR